jgi:hypothetical protein
METSNLEILKEAQEYKAELLKSMFGRQMSGIAAQALNQGRSIRVCHLPTRSNIIGVGFGTKVSTGQSTSEEVAVRIYVREKKLNSALSFREKVPPQINGVPTDVIPIGKISALGRPVECGNSIGHYRVTAGTLGCLVSKAGLSHEWYILSNNHVLANCNQSQLGDNILEPGLEDGGDPLKPIAKLAEYERLYFQKRFLGFRIADNKCNVMDAAIAKVLDCSEVSPEITGIGRPQQQPMFPDLGQVVCKHGRKTQYRLGVVDDISADFSMEYPPGRYADFEGQIAIGWTNMAFSDKGDSGSLVLDEASHRPIGLLFAGGGWNGRNLSFATPIERILERFQVDIV